MSAHEWGEEWDEVADVVVIGAGAAGGTAAATAVAAGASVIVVEKAAFAGGTTGKSGGQMWVPDNPLLRARGLVDDRADALRYMARTAYPVLYNPDHETLGLPADRYEVLAAFYDHGREAVELLLELGAATLESIPYADYYAQLPENTCPEGRTIAPILPPGWVPGRDATGGQMLVDQLLDYSTGAGARVLVDHRVVRALRNTSGEVVGVETRTGPRTVLIGARKGVVFCSGGFLHDERLVLEHLKGPVIGGAAAREATGDFVRIATELGARFGNMQNAWWDQVSVEIAVRRRETTNDVYSPFGDAMLMVNRYGRRVVNEKAPYNERGQAHFVWDQFRGEYPNLLLFMIFDETVVETPDDSIFRWPVPKESKKPRRYIITVDRLEDLEARIAERLEALSSHIGGWKLDEGFTEGLLATVARFNEMATRGVDEDFHRGETLIEKKWAGPLREGAPSPSLYPLSGSGPYHCVILGPGALDTKGGPVTDRHGRVIDVHGAVIPGLYGAGNCVASPAGQAYWGPGGTIGLAVTFGYLAARHAVAEHERVPEVLA